MSRLLLGGFSKGWIIMYIFLSFVILGFSFFEDAVLGTNVFVSSQVRHMLWVVLPIVIAFLLWGFFKKRIEENNSPEEVKSSGSFQMASPVMASPVRV